MAEGERPVAGDGPGGEEREEKPAHIEGFAGMPTPDEQAPAGHVAVEGPGYAMDVVGTDEDVAGAQGGRATPG